jgi:hypothetical protein
MAELGAGWSYKKAIVVDQTDDIGATNYQMKITVHYGGADVDDNEATGVIHTPNASVADFDDLRFTQSNGTTLIDYWIESKTDSNNAVVWVEIPMLDDAADTTIYMYYGNAGASAVGTSQEMGTATFTLFDEFTVDLAKWTVDVGVLNTDYVLDTANSLIKFRMSSAATNIKSDNAYAVNKRVRFRSKADDSGAILTGTITFANGYDDARDDSIIFQHYLDGYQYWTTYDGGTIDSAGFKNQAFTAGQWYLTDFLWTATGVSVYINNSLKDTFTNKIPNANLNVRLNGYYGADYTYLDWVFVANYTANEPTWSSFGAETSATGWANIAKVNGIASADMAKVNGIAVADIAKIYGVAV